MARQQNFDIVKSYKTMESLVKALSKFNDFGDDIYIPMVIPYGKNQGRYTAVFPARNGEGIHWVHRGFIVM